MSNLTRLFSKDSSWRQRLVLCRTPCDGGIARCKQRGAKVREPGYLYQQALRDGVDIFESTPRDSDR